MPHYALRFTPYPQTQAKDDFCRSAFPMFLESIGVKNYMLGRETAKNIHYHIVLDIEEEINKKQFKDILYLTMEVPKDKQGNTSFSLEEVRDFDKACQYATKDGDIECTEEWEELMTDAYSKSKKKPQSVRDVMEDLYSRFEKNEINERTLWIQLALQRAQFSTVKTRYSEIDAIVETFKIKKLGEQYVTEIWENRNIKLS